MKKYIYKNKKTGKKIYSDKLLDDNNLVLVSQLKDIKMKSGEVITK
jgi:hypothetical protein